MREGCEAAMLEQQDAFRRMLKAKAEDRRNASWLAWCFPCF
jgi:hypothetical protein